MSPLFESTRINGMELKNRFVRSATHEAMAGLDGVANDRLLACMADLAKGEIGLVITGHAHVTLEGQASPRQMGIYSDAMIDSLKKVALAVHANGGVVAVQLAHAGKRGIGKQAHAPMGPSDVFEKDSKTVSAMTTEDIKRTVKAFGDAAQRAVKAGFDAVQIHGAHGYLLSQFLSPYYNFRDDDYGGSLENRARLLIQVYREIRQRVGGSFPIMVKINSEDFLEGGFTLEEMIRVAKMLEDLGMDAIEMSGGTFESGKRIPSRGGTSKSEDREVYYRKAAQAFKKKIRIPLILVGGFLSYPLAEAVIRSGDADYIALARPLIREPGLVKRWAANDHEKASCISCNRCFLTLSTEEALHCAQEKKEKQAKKEKE
ncbi:MAG: NADH:flavin oxidoreductase [Proteobacteria bacterium]|nr:NADH:flavin oxidoreductase [Desulfobacula sp.]MBU3953915.1 NADH:flavin oxidoreductase [Pseudomonadota bacterium]MBU4132562.1 NADH:flavin oxidoreductase [Pseudomonadota bacterium]